MQGGRQSIHFGRNRGCGVLARRIPSGCNSLIQRCLCREWPEGVDALAAVPIIGPQKAIEGVPVHTDDSAIRRHVESAVDAALNKHGAAKVDREMLIEGIEEVLRGVASVQADTLLEGTDKMLRAVADLHALGDGPGGWAEGMGVLLSDRLPRSARH